jgi:hypothetical protein
VTAESSKSLNYEALNQLDFGSRASDLALSRVVLRSIVRDFRDGFRQFRLRFTDSLNRVAQKKGSLPGCPF